jgi:hypothetical protein
MKQFAVKVLVFIAGFCLINYLLVFLTDRGLKKSVGRHYEVWNDLYGSKINADMLFCGNSRAFQQYSPKVFDSVLNLNSYNIGMDGWSFIMQLARLNIYLHHNRKPSYIVQNIDMSTFFDKKELFGYDQFLPYLSDSLIVNACHNYKGAFTIPEIYFPFFKYNNQYRLVIQALAEDLKIRHAKKELYKGFAAHNLPWDGQFDKVKKELSRINRDSARSSFVFETNTLVIFNQFLDYCQNNNIRIFLVFAPTYYEALELDPCLEIYKQMFVKIACRHKVTYLDYSKDSICYDRGYFFNSAHLNLMGATKFSEKLAEQLKQRINGLPK